MTVLSRHSNGNCEKRGCFEGDEVASILAKIVVWSPFDHKELVWNGLSEFKKQAIRESGMQGNINYWWRGRQSSMAVDDDAGGSKARKAVDDAGDPVDAGSQAAGSSTSGGALNAVAFTFTH